MKLLPRLRALLISSVLFLSASPFTAAAEETMQNLGREEKQIRESSLDLLYASKFDELEKLAKEYNDKRERVPGGVWKLRHLSDGLANPKNIKDENEWKWLLEQLEEWRKKSGSAFSINALGHAQLEYAWNARGHSFAGSVGREKWPVFEEWVEKADVTLRAAAAKDPNCVDVYRSLLHVGISQGWPRPKMDAMFKRAIKVAPEYYDNFYNMAFYLMERWHGSPGDWQKFLNSIPKLVPGDEGFVVYTRTAMQLYPYYKDSFFGEGEDGVHWSSMKKGFEAILSKYHDIFNRNRFGFYAWKAEDRESAKKVMTELAGKHQFFAEAWVSQENMDAAKKWLGIVEQ